MALYGFKRAGVYEKVLLDKTTYCAEAMARHTVVTSVSKSSV